MSVSLARRPEVQAETGCTACYCMYERYLLDLCDCADPALQSVVWPQRPVTVSPSHAIKPSRRRRRRCCMGPSWRNPRADVHPSPSSDTAELGQLFAANFIVDCMTLRRCIRSPPPPPPAPPRPLQPPRLPEVPKRPALIR